MLDHVPLLQLLLLALRERSVTPSHDQGAPAARRPDAGYTTEMIIATALVAAICIAAVTALGAKILAKVAGIELG